MAGQIEPGTGWGLDNQGGISTPGQQQGQTQKPMAPPDKSDTNIDPKENGRKNRDQGLEKKKKKASDADETTNPNLDPDDLVESDDESPVKTPDSDADRPSV
jgi:hypothetical protein